MPDLVLVLHRLTLLRTLEDKPVVDGILEDGHLLGAVLHMPTPLPQITVKEQFELLRRLMLQQRLNHLRRLQSGKGTLLVDGRDTSRNRPHFIM